MSDSSYLRVRRNSSQADQPGKSFLLTLATGILTSCLRIEVKQRLQGHRATVAHSDLASFRLPGVVVVKILRTFGDMHTGVGLVHISPGQIPRSHERQFDRMKEKRFAAKNIFARLYGDSQS